MFLVMAFLACHAVVAPATPIAPYEVDETSDGWDDACDSAAYPCESVQIN